MTTPITDERLQSIAVRHAENFISRGTLTVQQHAGVILEEMRDAIADLLQALRERTTYSAETHGPVLASEINALPDRLRAYVADLEQQADPAHDMRRAYLAEE